MTFVTLTGAEAQEYLHEDGYYLGASQFTFSIPGAGATWAGYGAGSEITDPDFALPTAALGSAFRSAIRLWDALIAPDFVERNESNGQIGELRVAFTDVGEGTWGYAYQGTPRAPGTAVGDVWVGADFIGSDFAVGSYDYLSLIHEVGHTLGLKHPFEPPLLPAEYDDIRFTVMAYEPIEIVVSFTQDADLTLYANFDYAQAVTPMVLDIAAVQAIYGAETTTAAGDTEYRFNQNDNFVQSIYDAGGNDTLVLSNFTRPVEIYLTPGAYSSLGVWTEAAQIDHWEELFPGYGNFISAQISQWESDLYTWEDNLGIALSTIIENARGGSANDVLFGNHVANVLEGMSGDDYLHGEAGNDTLNGGVGDDTMFGGLGDDIFYVGSLGDEIVEEFGEGIDTVRALIDYTLGANLETLILMGIDAHVGTGNGLGNRLSGRYGSDTLSGMSGSDILRGYNGADTLNGGSDSDYLYGGGQRDTLTGGGGRDTFVFGTGDTASLYGTADNITDFNRRQGDRIDLSAVDAIAGGGDDTFVFQGTAAFSGVAGQLRYQLQGGNTLVQGDTNGDGTADLAIRLTGQMALFAADFIL